MITNRTSLSTTAAALLLATTAGAELAFFDSRPEWEAAAKLPLFKEDFESFQRDVLLDLEPATLLGGAIVITAESSHNVGMIIDSPADGTSSGVGGIDFAGNFISAEANNQFTGLLRIEIPPGAGPVHSISFDYSGISGALNAVDNPLYVGYRVETDDGAVTEGRVTDLDGDDVQGDGVRPPDEGFFGAHAPDRAIVSLELFTLFTTFDFPNSGKGEAYAIDNLTIGLSDEDGDGLPDAFEKKHGLDDSTDDSSSDLDLDGLSNLEEFRHHTDPARPDSDRDGVADGTEVTAGNNPIDRNDPVDFDLWVDFGSITQGYPYQDYVPSDQRADEFDSRNYPAFGGSVTVAPSFPDTTEATAQRMVQRPFANNTWINNGSELLQDFLGVDTDPSAGGNGSYDGVNGDPTRLTLNLGGVPTGSYTWTSMHHDFDDIRTEFIAEISTNGGASFREFARTRMTYSRVGGATGIAGSFHGPLPELLPSTVTTSFEADGINDVVVRFTPLPTGTATTRLFGINGFQLSQTADLSPPLAIIEIAVDESAGTVSLTWTSAPGRTYAVESTSNLQEIQWFELEDAIPAATTDFRTTRSFTFPTDGGLPTRQFFRVREEQ